MTPVPSSCARNFSAKIFSGVSSIMGARFLKNQREKNSQMALPHLKQINVTFVHNDVRLKCLLE